MHFSPNTTRSGSLGHRTWRCLLATGTLIAGALSGCAPTFSSTDGGLVLSPWVRDTEVQLRPGGSETFFVTLEQGYAPGGEVYDLSTLPPPGLFINFNPRQISAAHPTAMVIISAALNAEPGLRSFFLQASGTHHLGSLAALKVRIE